MKRTNLRLPAPAYRGHILVSITICAKARRRIFLNADAVDLCIRALDEVAQQTHYRIPVYCFMPDHLHLLLQGVSADADARRFMASFKQISGHRMRRLDATIQWQRGYYDHVLRSEEEMQDHVRYILNNPVRAGLTDRPREYPYTGSIGWDLDVILSTIG